MLSSVFILKFLSFTAGAAGSNHFLEVSHKAQHSLPDPAQDREILHAIEESISSEHREATERRLIPLQELLAPTLAALPKNEYGRFGHKSVRYALHRLFVQRHAWFVKGIELDGDWGTADPLRMLEGNVPERVQSLFEKRLGMHGLTPHDIAVMAATVENLAHAESLERLETIYKFLDLDSASLSMEQADHVLDTYMAIYITDVDIKSVSAEQVTSDSLIQAAEASYPGWSEVVPWVRRMKKQALSQAATSSSLVAFANMTNVLTLIGDQFGRWQAHECLDLKKQLFSIEDDGTGRVALAKFYERALNGQWQFGESASYLRTIGALDESRASKQPRVIVTNYILSPSNCVASSKYYSVCCHDECEDILGNFERSIQAPVAEPGRIVELANSTMPIGEQLRLRLDDIAAENGGFVPLHGRLFAQWMHHAYPRECPYPHLSGTTKPMREEQFAVDTGLETGATEEEMQGYIDARQGQEDTQSIEWSAEDELFVERHVMENELDDRLSTTRTAIRVLAFGGSAVLVVMLLLQNVQTVTAFQGGQAQAKYSL
jgi:hypothetical protein